MVLNRLDSSASTDATSKMDEKIGHTELGREHAMPMILEDSELEGDDAGQALKGQNLDFTEDE